MSNVVVTPEARVSYPTVFKPKLNKLNKKEEYSLVLLFPKGTDLAPLKKAAEVAMEEVFGADKSKWPKKYNHPFKDQAERFEAKGEAIPNGYEKGAIMINARSTQKPGLVKQVGPNQVETIIDPAEFYAGCYAKVQLSFYAYDHESGQKGVNCSVLNICKTRDGDPLSGRPSAESAFTQANGTGTQASAGGLFD